MSHETAWVARAACRNGNAYRRLREELGYATRIRTFRTYSPGGGQPAESPWQLALVSVLQYAEGLADVQAADSVRGRIDWKCALGLELPDPGFDASVLSEFRTRLVQGSAEWLRGHLNPAWLECYSPRVDEYRFPKGMAEQKALAATIGADGVQLYRGPRRRMRQLGYRRSRPRRCCAASGCSSSLRRTRQAWCAGDVRRRRPRRAAHQLALRHGGALQQGALDCLDCLQGTDHRLCGGGRTSSPMSQPRLLWSRRGDAPAHPPGARRTGAAAGRAPGGQPTGAPGRGGGPVPQDTHWQACG